MCPSSPPFLFRTGIDEHVGEYRAGSSQPFRVTYETIGCHHLVHSQSEIVLLYSHFGQHSQPQQKETSSSIFPTHRILLDDHKAPWSVPPDLDMHENLQDQDYCM